MSEHPKSLSRDRLDYYYGTKNSRRRHPMKELRRAWNRAMRRRQNAVDMTVDW